MKMLHYYDNMPFIVSVRYDSWINIAQSAAAVEYTDCTSAEG